MRQDLEKNSTQTFAEISEHSGCVGFKQKKKDRDSREVCLVTATVSYVEMNQNMKVTGT